MSENRPLIECFTIINSKLIPKYVYSKDGERTIILKEIKAVSNQLKELFKKRAWVNTKKSLKLVDRLISYLASLKEGDFDNNIKNSLNSLLLNIEKEIRG